MSGLTFWVDQGDIKSIYPELALYSSKNGCVRTDTVFFPISEVSGRAFSLRENKTKSVFVIYGPKYNSFQDY